MTNKIGSQTRIGVVLPGAARLARIPNLSVQAKIRLKWIDYYNTHNRNARLTCRHLGIAHRSFYRYFKRCQVSGLQGLESGSRRPHKLRTPTTPIDQIDLVRKLRRHHPEYSKYKLQILLTRDYGIRLSASTIGRIITRYQLFFTPPIKPKGHPHRIVRRRKPAKLPVAQAGDLVEFDVKHLPMLGKKRYGFAAIDVATRKAAIHVSSSISSNQAKLAWQKLCQQWGKPRAVLNDNGSENLGQFAKLLKDQQVDHYFARPHTPKDKPHIERFIGTLERECIQWGGLAVDLADQQRLIDVWLEKYHNVRPHQALGYLTPNEYTKKLESEVALII